MTNFSYQNTFKTLAIVLFSALLMTGCTGKNQKTASYQGLKALERGDFSLAASFLEQAVEFAKTPEQTAVLQNYLGVALARMGRYNDAMVAFGGAYSLAPKKPEPVYNLAIINLLQGRTNTSVNWFLKAADLMPNETQALEYLSHICRKENNLVAAQEYLLEAQRRRPNQPGIITAQGLTMLLADDLNGASLALQEALEVAPLYPPAIFNLALLREKQNDPIAARSLFHEYTRLEGANHSQIELALNSISELNYKIKTPAQPLQEDPLPVAQHPSEQNLLETARHLAQRGRSEAAVNHYLLAARRAEHNSNNVVLRASLKEIGPACADSPKAHYNFGLYLREKKQPKDAMTHLKKAVELDSQWSDAFLALAPLAIEQAEFDTAIEVLKMAVKLRPADPNALWSLVLLYDRELSMFSKALEHYELFLNRFPSDMRAENARERLLELKARERD